MWRWILFVPMCMSALAPSTVAQTRVAQDPGVEPHYHLILQNDLIRVYEVYIPEGQETYVRHQHNFLTVSLQDARLVMWSEGTVPGMVFPVRSGDMRFFTGGAALGIRNDGKTEYRNITVEFLDPRVTNYGYQQSDGQIGSYSSTAMGPPPDDRSGFVHALPLHLAAVRDARLLPGEQLPAVEQPARELVIAVTDLDLQSVSGRLLKKRSGEIAWLPKRSPGLTNRGNVPARLVIVELLSLP